MSLLARAILIGKITGPATGNDNLGSPIVNGVGTPKNATAGKARLMQVRIGPQLQTVQLITQAGEDYYPPNGSVVAIIDSAGIKLGVATYDGITPQVLSGERRLYASDGAGNVLGRMKFKANSKILIGNAGGNLCAQLDALLNALNTFSGTAAQAAITAGNTTSITLAAAINVLLAALTVSITSVKSAIDAILDTTE